MRNIRLMNGIYLGESNMKKSTFKVPGGKLLKILLHSKGDKIESIQIMGDFFLHPESAIIEIEQSLVGSKIVEETLTEIIHNYLTNTDTTLIGASPNDVAKAIMMAFEQ